MKHEHDPCGLSSQLDHYDFRDAYGHPLRGCTEFQQLVAQAAQVSHGFEGWWLVYPRGDKLELTDSVRPVAAFAHEGHAREFCARMWPGTGEVRHAGPAEPETEWLHIPAFLRIDPEEAKREHQADAAAGMPCTCCTFNQTES